MADLFNPASPASSLMGWAVKLRTRLSESTNFQAMAEKADAATALEALHLGRGPKPAAQEEFTLEEIQSQFCVATISWIAEEGYRVSMGEGSSDASDKQGLLYVGLRRYVRPQELANSPNDIECHLWDLTAAIAEDMRVESATTTCLTVLEVAVNAMEFAGYHEKPSDSDVWFADYVVSIGSNVQ